MASNAQGEAQSQASCSGLAEDGGSIAVACLGLMPSEVASAVLLSDTRTLGSHMARDSQALTYREERENRQLSSADIFDQNALLGGILYFVPRFFSSGLVIWRYATSGASRASMSVANVGRTGVAACFSDAPEKQA